MSSLDLIEAVSRARARIRVITWGRYWRIQLDKLRLKIGLRPAQKYALNPMTSYPRNLACWCGSMKKSKKCCLPKQGKYCLAKDAATLAGYMKHVNYAMKEG